LIGIDFIQLATKLFIVLSVLLCLVLIIEFVPDWLKSMRRRSRNTAKIDLDYRNQADVFKTVDWGPRYFYEYWSAVRNLMWLPYVYGRSRPFAGKYINVNNRGFRQGWNPKPVGETAREPLRVFVFGGSTCWGMGARDDYTVPSELSKILNAKIKSHVEVLNFAENGHVATQSLLTLMMELRRGNVPDIVVFYDGINDSFSAHQNGEAGIPQNEYNRRAEFNVLHKDMRYLFYRAAMPILFRRSLRLIDKVVNVFVSKDKNTKLPVALNPELPHSVLSVYSDIMHQVRSYGARYEFESCFFWQPSLFTKKQLTEFEASEKQVNIRYAEILAAVHSKIAGFSELNKANGFYDISDIFDDQSEGLYLDFAHVSEKGNQIIAEAMAPEIIEVIKAKYK